jgi:hypothetical protein
MAGLLGGGTVLRRSGTNFWLLRPFSSGCREPVPLNPTCTNTQTGAIPPSNQRRASSVTAVSFRLMSGQTLVLDPLVFLGRKRPALDAAIVDFVVFAIADCAFG